MEINILFLEEKCNGDVRFDVTDLETGTSTVPKRSSSTVKVIRRRQSGYGIAITRFVCFSKSYKYLL